MNNTGDVPYSNNKMASSSRRIDCDDVVKFFETHRFGNESSSDLEESFEEFKGIIANESETEEERSKKSNTEDEVNDLSEELENDDDNDDDSNDDEIESFEHRASEEQQKIDISVHQGTEETSKRRIFSAVSHTRKGDYEGIVYKECSLNPYCSSSSSDDESVECASDGILPVEYENDVHMVDQEYSRLESIEDLSSSSEEPACHEELQSTDQGADTTSDEAISTGGWDTRRSRQPGARRYAGPRGSRLRGYRGRR